MIRLAYTTFWDIERTFRYVYRGRLLRPSWLSDILCQFKSNEICQSAVFVSSDCFDKFSL